MNITIEKVIHVCRDKQMNKQAVKLDLLTTPDSKRFYRKHPFNSKHTHILFMRKLGLPTFMCVAVAGRYNLSYAANITGTVSTSEDRSRQ